MAIHCGLRTRACRTGRWAVLLFAALFAIVLSANSAAAQAVCSRSYTVSQTGGRQLIVDGTRINAGNPCGFPAPPPGGAPLASQISINGVAANIVRTLRYANGATVERDASGSLWFTPGTTYAASMVIFGDPTGGGAVTATDGNSTGVVLLLALGSAANGARYKVTINVSAPPVTAPSASGTVSQASLYIGQNATFAQRFINPNAFDIAVSNSTAAPSGLTFSGSPSGTCSGGSVLASAQALAVQGVTVPANSSCTVTATVTAAAAGLATLAPGAPTGTAFGNSSVGAAGAPLDITVQAPLPPTASTAVTPTRIAAGSVSRVTVTLANANGGVALSGVGNVVLLPAGLVLAADPAFSSDCGGSGDAAAGSDRVTVSNAGLQAGATCSFSFGVSAGAAGNYAVASGAPFASDAGTGLQGAAATLTVLAPPVITGLAPAVGSTAGGGAIAIGGSGFDDVQTVRFGTVSASFIRESASRIVATSPAGQADAVVRITVVTDGGTSADTAADDFLYRAPPAAPAITAPTDGSVLAAGTFDIRGTAEAGALVEVKIDGSAAGSVTANLSGDWRFSSAVAAGAHQVQATAIRESIRGGASGVIGFTGAAPMTAAGGQAISVAVGVPLPPTATIVASGGAAPYAFSLSGTLPSGLSFDTATGRIGGTPRQALAETERTVAVADRIGQTASATFALSVAKGSQTVGFSSVAPVGARLGDDPYRASATATSGLPVGLAIDSASAATCALREDGVHFLAPGTCTIVAEQPGSADWSAAGPATQIFTVAPAVLAIAASPPAGAMVGTPFSQANAASGGVAPYRYAVSAGALPPSLVLDMASGQVSGTPMVAGNFAYAVRVTDAAGATATTASIAGAVAKGIQSVSFVSSPPDAAVIAGRAYVPLAVSGSGLAAVFAIAPTSTGICALDGGAITFAGAGQCVIEAGQPGDANWNAAAAAQQSFPVAPPPLTIAAASNGAGTVGIAFAQVNAIAGGIAPYRASLASGTLPSGLAIDPASGAVAGVASHAGTYSYRLQVVDASGATATSAPIALNIGKGTQTIAFTTSSPPSARVGDGAYVPAVAATSGLAVTLALDAAGGSVCTLSGGAVTFTAPGTCMLHADQPGDDDWLQAATAQQSFTVRAAALAVVSQGPAGRRSAVAMCSTTPPAAALRPIASQLPTGKYRLERLSTLRQAK